MTAFSYDCPAPHARKITGEELTYFFALAAARGLATSEVRSLLASRGLHDSREITADIFDSLCAELRARAETTGERPPLRVKYDSSLSALTRLIYTDIESRCSRGRRLSAVTDWELAELYDITERSVGRAITALSRKGYITREMLGGRRYIGIPSVKGRRGA